MSATNHFSLDKKVAFATLDCTVHRPVCLKYEVKGYPMLKYFSYGKKEFRYVGGRKKDHFVEFMSDPSSFTRDEL